MTKLELGDSVIIQDNNLGDDYIKLTGEYILKKKDDMFILEEKDSDEILIRPKENVDMILGILEHLNEMGQIHWYKIKKKKLIPDDFYTGLNALPDNPKAYIVGDILKKGAANCRIEEAKKLREIGLDVHSAAEDESINDKSKNSGDRLKTLAERIVINDANAIAESNLVIAETSGTIGSITETGFIHGFNYLHDKVMDILNDNELNGSEKSFEVKKLLNNKYPKKYFMPHIDDLRMQGSPEGIDSYFRAEYHVNAYLAGTLLSLTNGRGLLDIEQIYEILNNKYGDSNE